MEASAPEAEAVFGVPVTSVVADGFCVPYPVELVVNKKNLGFFDSSYEALDINGNLFLQIKGTYQNLQKKRVMRDASGFPLLTMCEKVVTSKHRWIVYRGERPEGKEVLFRVQRSHSFQIMKSKHEVFLTSNVNEDIPDFQAIESKPFESYKIYKGHSIISEVLL
ncbi:hypothetical protein UlMin_043873 [Ulmus minor]